MLPQELINVEITNICYREDGDVWFEYAIEGDATNGAGQVDVKIEVDNVQVSSSTVFADMPGKTSMMLFFDLNDKTPGATHVFKVTATKDRVVKTTSENSTFPVQSDLDKIDINFTHRETIPENIITDTFSFINIGNSGTVRFAIDEDVTDKSTIYRRNDIETIPNNDNKIHVINYRYKCGTLVTIKKYIVNHSNHVPCIYPNPVLTQVDNNHYEISIYDFANNGSLYEVTDTSKIKVRVTYNDKYIDFDYADFTGNKLNVELNYSTKITCFVYNTEYSTDKSKDVILNFVYKIPDVKMLKPIISWKYVETDKPGDKRRKVGIIINCNFDAIKNLNIKEYPNIESYGTLYTIYTKDRSIPNINNTIEKLTEEKTILDTNDAIYYFRNVFVYNDKKRNPKYSDSLVFIYNISGKGNPFYFDYEKPSLEYPSNICSYLDVIYNNDYNNSKSLESINYILNYFDNRYSLNANNIYNVAEDGLRHRYAGYYLDVYTDETQAINLTLSDGSNDTDENNRDTFNHYNDYKFAKFDKGSWNFNYFRNGFNIGNTELSETELVRACNYIYYNPNTKQNEVHVITEEDLKKSPLYKSDNRSLIYGKYIVTRFIFNNDDAAHRFKLENITFNIQPY